MLDNLITMTGGDTERIKIYIQLYKKSIPDITNTIEMGINKNNVQLIYSGVHSGKSLFSTMGFSKLFNLAEEIEKAIREKRSWNDICILAKKIIQDISLSINLIE